MTVAELSAENCDSAMMGQIRKSSLRYGNFDRTRRHGGACPFNLAYLLVPIWNIFRSAAYYSFLKKSNMGDSSMGRLFDI